MLCAPNSRTMPVTLPQAWVLQGRAAVGGGAGRLPAAAPSAWRGGAARTAQAEAALDALPEELQVGGIQTWDLRQTCAFSQL